jgi:hypothetical protein
METDKVWNSINTTLLRSGSEEAGGRIRSKTVIKCQDQFEDREVK